MERAKSTQDSLHDQPVQKAMLANNTPGSAGQLNGKWVFKQQRPVVEQVCGPHRSHEFGRPTWFPFLHLTSCARVGSDRCGWHLTHGHRHLCIADYGGACFRPRQNLYQLASFFHYPADHLGTSRVIVQAGQTTCCYDAGFDPFTSAVISTEEWPNSFWAPPSTGLLSGAAYSYNAATSGPDNLHSGGGHASQNSIGVSGSFSLRVDGRGLPEQKRRRHGSNRGDHVAHEQPGGVRRSAQERLCHRAGRNQREGRAAGQEG